MFNVNNKDTRTKPGVVLVSLVSFLLTLNLFHTLFQNFIVNFERVNTCWDGYKNKQVVKIYDQVRPNKTYSGNVYRKSHLATMYSLR